MSSNEVLKSPKDMGMQQSANVDWSMVKKNIYQGNKEKSYELLKTVDHDNLSNLDNQIYYFYLGKYYHINNYLSSAAKMYTKSYLYAQIGSFPTLESKKSAINLSNIMIETADHNKTITGTLFDPLNEIIVSKSINVEELLKFSIDPNYPRGYYLLAAHYSNVLYDKFETINYSEKIRSINLILSNLAQYLRLKKGNDEIDIRDTTGAVELETNLLHLKSVVAEQHYDGKILK